MIFIDKPTCERYWSRKRNIELGENSPLTAGNRLNCAATKQDGVIVASSEMGKNDCFYDR